MKLAKKGHGPHSSTLVVICVVQLLFVLFCVLLVCKCVLPPGDNPIAVNKYINTFVEQLVKMRKYQKIQIQHFLNLSGLLYEAYEPYTL